jgi:Cu+-exporting ATPase
MFVAINGKAAGIFTVSDPVKASTRKPLKQLHKLGMKIIMLTGDNERTANAVAKKLGLDEVSPAGVEPKDKQ